MASFQIYDETFYWFITVKAPAGSDTDRGIMQGLGLQAAPLTEVNLWPCRKCGALVPGALRNVHRNFHEGVSTE